MVASDPQSVVILVVDDEPSVRQIVQTVLTRRGYQVLTAAAGPEALELSHQHVEPIDLLVTDVLMPGMTGAELVTRLLAERPTLRVLFMSGFADPADDPPAPVASRYLAKPFPMAELVQAVEELLA